MSQKLAGKVAVVTGASKGIGAEIARALAAAGAKVVVNYSSSQAGADKVVEDIRSQGGQAVALKANLSNEADIQQFFGKVKEQFGKVDVLVNNAGVYEFAPLESITADHFHKQFDLNVLGLLLATREALPLIPASGGAIVNISSVVATAAPPASAVYSATKAAVDAITHSLSKELGPRQIRVNSVNPGMVETEGTHSAGFIDGDFHQQILGQTPLGRIGQPRDIASVVTFLASDDAGWITGETLHVAGGFR